MKYVEITEKAYKEEWDRLGEDIRQEYYSFAKEEGYGGGAVKREAFKAFCYDYKEGKEASRYRDGGYGCILWAEENVRFKIPVDKDGHAIYKWITAGELPDNQDEYGRSYKRLWEIAKAEITNALETEQGMYKNDLNVFCWPRGEGKTWITILLVLHRFFNFPFQRIYLIGSSKEQSSDTLLGEIREVIENSPRLYDKIGKKGILSDQIKMNRGLSGRFNFIKLLTTFSGLRSNATMIVQTEAFEVEDDSLFSKWFGSLRNIPDGMGIIDTTVSHKKHFLFRLYKNYQKNPDGNLYFSYKFASKGHPSEYNHPGMTQRKLDGFKNAFTKHDFSRFFKNLWDDAGDKVFDLSAIMAIEYVGYEDKIGESNIVFDCMKQMNPSAGTPIVGGYDSEKLIHVNSIFDLGSRSLVNEDGIVTPEKETDLAVVKKLTLTYRTFFALLVGVDMSEALKQRVDESARSVVVWMLKGLPGSIDMSVQDKMGANLKYIYILIGMAVIQDHQPSSVNKILRVLHDNLGGINKVTSDPYGMAHVKPFCSRKGIPFNPIYANRQRQNVGVRELSGAIHSGRFKAPPIPIPGSRQQDILREELGNFDVISSAGKTVVYGSPTKFNKNGVQDDVIDAICQAMFGGLEVGADSFKERFERRMNSPVGVFSPPGSFHKRMERQIRTNLGQASSFSDAFRFS